MKNFYKVSNTIENGPRMDRVKSRISPINHRLWTVIAPMLFVAFGLFGVNEEMWATWPTYSGTPYTPDNGKTYYVLYEGDTEITLMNAASSASSKEYSLSGPCGMLTFDLLKQSNIATGSVKVDAGSNEDVKTVGVGDFASKNKWKGFDKDLASYVSTTTKIKFHAHGTLTKKLRNAKVVMFSGVLQPKNAANNANITTWTYTAADYAAEDSYKDFTVDWSNLASLPLSKAVNGSSDDRSQFSYTIRSNTQTLGGGKYGTATIRVYYKHDKVGTHSVKINVGDYSITFTGTTNKITPYIVTTPTVDTITYGQTISNSQLRTGLVKADLINAAGTVVPGTWTIDENGQTVTTSGGSNATVHLTFTPTDGNTYNTIHTTQSMFVRSASMITWASAYSAEKPTIPVGKTIESAATTTAAGATITYSTSDPTIIEIGEGGTSFRAIAEGEATVTASHGVTPTHGAASEEKTFKTTFKDIQVIVWNDRFDRLTTEMTSKNLLAQVWIENPVSGDRTYSAARTALLEYSVEDNTVVSIPENSTTLTIHKKGNTTLTASVEGDDQYESASVTMEVKVREPSAGCDDPLLLDIKNNGTNDYLYRFFQMNTNEIIGDEYAINVAQGQVPDKLSFGHKGEYYKPVSIIGSWTYFKGPIKAQQKVDGKWIDVPNSSVTPTVADWKELGDLQLDEKATHIRFVRPQGGEGYHYVRNVEVTMKHFIRTATPTVDFGNAIKVNSSEYRDVVINYSNVKDALKVVNPFISDVTVSDEVIDVDSCGAFGSDTLRIYFNPTTATEIDDYIVVKDPVVGNSSALSIRVKADVQRADQTITWNPATSISTIDQILLNGTTNGQEYGQMNVIGYEVTNNDGVISVTNNVVTILKPGTVTITASQPGTTNYDVAEPVEKNFTISAEPLTLVAPTASDITYGQALSESELSGGSAKDSKGNDVDGTFAWQNPDAVLNAGNNQTPTVVFTPSTNAAWYTNLTTTANINVAKADPVVTVENVSFAYGTKAEEVALDGTGDGEWSWTDSRKGQVLAVDTYEMDVHFAPTDDANYNAIDKKITLTVTKADPAATVENVSFAYGTKAEDVSLSGTGAGTWTWTDSRKDDVLAAGEYEMDVHFAPIDDANYNAIDTKITLTVNKANPAATVENVSFAYGTKAEDVSLSGTGAGTWTWTDSRKDQVLAVGEYEMDVHFAPTDGDNYNAIDTKITLTVNKIETLQVPVVLSFCAGGSVNFHGNTYSEAGEYQIEAEGATRDTVYNVTVTKLQPTTGTDSKTITVGANESWNGKDLSSYAVGSHEVEYHTTNVAGCDSTVTLSLTVVPLSNVFNNAEGDGDWGNANNWESGIVPTSNPDIIVTGALEINDSITVGSLTIEQTGSVTVISGGTLTVKGTSDYRSEYGDVHVLNDGELALGSSADLQVRNFKLDAKLGDGATKAASGQVRNEERMNINGEVYFQLSFDPSNAITFGWYDFAVPFAVNINGGITRIGSIDDRVMVSGVDFLIMEDDEVDFAAGGHGWRIMSSNGVLVPGKLYTISFNYQASLPQNTFQFAWNKQGTITNGTSYNAEYIVSSDDARTGWNAIGNGMLCHGYVDASYKLQTYNHTDNVYEIVYDPKTFAVGTAFFVQVLAAGDIDWTAAEATLSRPLYAPQREAKDVDEFRLSLRSESNDAVSDVLFFSASEEAIETYMIGHDLLKKGTPTEAKKAQMWAIKDGKNLCDVEAMLINEQASTPLSLYAPNAGQYTLTVEQTPEDANLYLTYNGNVIWDLTASPYVFDLAKGTTTGYGLRIVAANAPQITTGVEDVQGDGAQVRKVIIDNKMYIITPEGAIFDAIGKKVQ